MQSYRNVQLMVNFSQISKKKKTIFQNFNIFNQKCNRESVKKYAFA